VTAVNGRSKYRKAPLENNRRGLQSKAKSVKANFDQLSHRRHKFALYK
jgi:hypothetical protein